jgi:NAD(P)-dependent dehydrogenase (short-subunit alcohol dehydrogenase family)
MSTRLTGTVASSGIGHAAARELADRGASVALVARRQDRLEALVKEIDSAGGTALAVPTDIADRAQAENAVAETVARFGRLEVPAAAHLGAATVPDREDERLWRARGGGSPMETSRRRGG